MRASPVHQGTRQLALQGDFLQAAPGGRSTRCMAVAGLLVQGLGPQLAAPPTHQPVVQPLLCE